MIVADIIRALEQYPWDAKVKVLLPWGDEDAGVVFEGVDVLVIAQDEAERRNIAAKP